MRLPLVQATATTAGVLAGGALLGVNIVNNIFGVYDSTPDELADLLGMDDAPPALVRAVELLRPAYEPLKALAPSCSDALFPEFNDDLDMNDCLLLPKRVLWPGGKPLLIKQTMSTKRMWQSSTGSAVWGGGVTLVNYMDTLGPDYWAGKRVIELGTGSGLASINAARLGAATALATDRDPAVLKLAEENAAANLRSRRGAFATAEYNWGDAPPATTASAAAAGGGGGSGGGGGGGAWDLVIGADLTYNRDAWPALVSALKALDAPALLSASERRADELASLQAYLTENGLRYDVAPNPMAGGYAREKVRIFRIERPPPQTGTPSSATAASAAAPKGGARAAEPSPPRQQAQATNGGENAAPSAKELAGILLCATFNGDEKQGGGGGGGGARWYEVDAQLKQERIDWAYSVVSAKGYDLRTAPKPPAALLREAAAAGARPSPAESAAAKFGPPLS